MKLSLVMAYYENSTMLARQWSRLNRYDQRILNRFEYVVVDDGSPNNPAVPPQYPLFYDYQLWRIGVDIRWNQDAARNIGALHAKHDWLLLTDMDHMVPEETIAGILAGEWSERRAYKFTRVEFDTVTPYKQHPNSWLLHRSLYTEAGGYDERLAGCYGTDADFRNRVLTVASGLETLPLPLIRVGREHVADASCPREFGRKSPENAIELNRRLALRRSKKLPILNFVHPYALVSKTIDLEA